MVSQGSAIRPAPLELALVLFLAVSPILLFSASQMPRTATLGKQASLSKGIVADAYGKLPLSFEVNQGQTDPRVKFFSRGSGYSLFLTDNEAVLRLRKSDPVSKTEASFETISFKPRSRLATATLVTDSVVHMKLAGANPNAKVSGMEELPGKSNYFIGNDPKNWRTNVANYARVKYANIYPGVDLVYYGNQRQLEYDFIVQPAADPRQIEVSFNGANRLRLDANGNLIVSVAGGEVIEHKPVIYQNVDGMRWQVDGGYELRNDHTVGFKLARYDDHRRLTIDPGLIYSTYLGGSSDDVGQGIALDSSGNAFITGATESTDFPTTAGAFQTTRKGFNAFVSKLDSNGSALVYSTYLGGSSSDEAFGIAVDSSGNVYVTGQTTSSDFPTTSGAFQTSYGGNYDAFFTELNRSGSALVYSTFLGGSDQDVGNGIALDPSGNAYVTGLTFSSDFPTTAGAFQTTLGVHHQTAFVSKLNSSGLVYSTYLGGSYQDAGIGIVVDSSGNAYVTGSTASTDFPTTAGVFQSKLNGFDDAFVSKLNGSGSGLIYSTYLGGSLYNIGSAIALDSLGDAYVSGDTYSSDFPTTAGAFQTTFGGYIDTFASKLNSNGSALIYSTFLGGSNEDVVVGDAVDPGGNLYVTGVTLSSDFPTTTGAFQTIFGGGTTDAFVSKLSSSGSALLYSTYLGGNNDDGSSGIALDSAGNAYITGQTTSSDFPTTSGAFQTSYGGVGDAFVTKLSLATTVTFSSLTAKLQLTISTGSFDLNSAFTLGAASNGINPLTENVTLQIGPYSVTIPPGSFTKNSKGAYVFQGTVNSTSLQVRINPTTSNSYTFQVEGSGANLNGTTNPVTVTLTIGDDMGSSRVTAQIS